MKKLTIGDVATSYISIVFLGLSISGVMIYFKLSPSLVANLHRNLGLAFIVIALSHVAGNWKSMKNYFSKKLFFSACLIIPLVSGIFIFQSLTNPSPKALIIKGVIKAPLDEALSILNLKKEVAIKKLQEKGIKFFNQKSLGAIAGSNKISPFKIISIMTSK